MVPKTQTIAKKILSADNIVKTHDLHDLSTEVGKLSYDSSHRLTVHTSSLQSRRDLVLLDWEDLGFNNSSLWLHSSRNSVTPNKFVGPKDSPHASWLFGRNISTYLL